MRFLTLVIFFILISIGSFASVSITTNPASDQIQPDKDLVDTRILLPANSDYEIVIRTPKSNPFLSTDFPVVEDTQLYHFKGHTKSGQVGFKTIYPIRGTYNFRILLKGKWQSLELEVSESPNEINNVLIFFVAMLAIGILGGFFLQKTTLTVTTTMIMLLFLTISIEIQAHSGSHEVEKKGLIHWIMEEEGFRFSVLFDSNQAIVGQLVQFHIQLIEEEKIVQSPFTIKVQTFHLEDETMMFEGYFTSSVATSESCGLCSLNESFQFFDGAETKISFQTTLPSGKTLELDGVIDVEGISPPASSVIKSLVPVSLLVLVGIGVGFFLIPVNKQVVEHAV